MNIDLHLQSIMGTWLGTGKGLNGNEQGTEQVREVLVFLLQLPLSLIHSFIHSANVLSTCCGPGSVQVLQIDQVLALMKITLQHRKMKLYYHLIPKEGQSF
jgi:hypothetical protein